MAYSVDQAIANDQNEVALALQTLLNGATIVTFHDVFVVCFGTNQFIVLIVYE